MTTEHDKLAVMRYLDGEMTAGERSAFECHLEDCPECQKTLAELSTLKEVTRHMKIADLPQTVWDRYWTGVYNRIERSVAWFLFILGAAMLVAYDIYQIITDPTLESYVQLALMLLIVGFAVLLLSVIREKIAVNRTDRYQREVKR